MIFAYSFGNLCEKVANLVAKCKKMGVPVFVSDIKRVENYPDFDKLAHVIQLGLQGFIVKNIEGEST